MKKELINVINKMIDLLVECDFQIKADWLKERLDIIRKYNEREKEFIMAVKEIKNILGGMGSFSDLSMIPKNVSKMSREEASKKQWDLVEEFDKAVIGIIGI